MTTTARMLRLQEEQTKAIEALSNALEAVAAKQADTIEFLAGALRAVFLVIYAFDDPVKEAVRKTLREAWLTTPPAEREGQRFRPVQLLRDALEPDGGGLAQVFRLFPDR